MQNNDVEELGPVEPLTPEEIEQQNKALLAGHKDWQEVADKDHEAWKTWKSAPTKQNLSVLLKRMMPIVRTEVNRQKGSLPEVALMAEATKHAITAFHSFDPSRGAKLSTHLTTGLQKTRRLNYKYQTSARLSEESQRKVNVFNTAKNDLREELNREPTYEEMAGHLGWKVGKVQKFMEQATTDSFETGMKYAPEVSRIDPDIAFEKYLKTRLSREENALYTLTKVMPGDGRSSATGIAKAMGVSVNRYNYVKRKLGKKIEEHKREWDEIELAMRKPVVP